MEELRDIKQDSLPVSQKHDIADDRINVIDLTVVLVRRWRLIVTVLIVCSMSGMLRAVFVPDSYRYSTAIELARSNVVDEADLKNVQFESIDSALAKLAGVYIPETLDSFVKENDAVAAELRATNPKGSELIIIEARGPEKNRAFYVQLLESVAERLVMDHEAALIPLKSRFESELERARLHLQILNDDRVFAVEESAVKQQLLEAENRLLDMRDEKTILEAVYKTLDKEEGLVLGRLNEVEGAYQAAIKNRTDLADGSNDAAASVKLMMLSNEIQRYQDRLTELNERLIVGLPAKRQQLEKKIASNKRLQEQQAKIIAEQAGKLALLPIDRKNKESVQLLTIKDLESRIADIRPTQVIHQVTRSVKPVGYGLFAQLFVAMILGLMLGIFAAFGIELLGKAKKL